MIVILLLFTSKYITVSQLLYVENCETLNSEIHIIKGKLKNSKSVFLVLAK